MQALHTAHIPNMHLTLVVEQQFMQLPGAAVLQFSFSVLSTSYWLQIVTRFAETHISPVYRLTNHPEVLKAQKRSIRHRFVSINTCYVNSYSCLSECVP